MIRLKAQNPDVFTADEPIVQFSRDEVGYLKELAPRSARKRVRICAHKDSGLPLNEMLLLFARGTYIRPSKHIGKEESLHVVDGRGLYVFFDEKGRMNKAIPVGDLASGRSFYVRTPPEVYHSLLVESDFLVLHEVTQGPFRREDTVYADWAPADGDPAIAATMEKMLSDAKALAGKK